MTFLQEGFLRLNIELNVLSEELFNWLLIIDILFNCNEAHFWRVDGAREGF